MLCVRLNEKLQKRFGDFCSKMKRSEEEIVVEALDFYLEEQEDLLIATSRLKDESDQVIGIDEMRRRLGLEN